MRREGSQSSLFDWTSGSEYLNTSKRHLQRLWAERRITGRKIGKKVRFTQGDLDDFIERCRVDRYDAG